VGNLLVIRKKLCLDRSDGVRVQCLKFCVVVLDLPATAAVDTPPSQETTAVVSGCPMYSLSTANCTSAASAAMSRQITDGNASNGMEWYSGELSRHPQTLSDEPRVDVLDPQFDISGLYPKSVASGSDLGNIDMSDWLEDIGCGMTVDFMNVTDDCDLCSPADGVRATFEKIMEVTTSHC